MIGILLARKKFVRSARYNLLRYRLLSRGNLVDHRFKTDTNLHTKSHTYVTFYSNLRNFTQHAQN